MWLKARPRGLKDPTPVRIWQRKFTTMCSPMPTSGQFLQEKSPFRPPKLQMYCTAALLLCIPRLGSWSLSLSTSYDESP